MFTLPDLPYPAMALEPAIDERTMQIHHDKHHAAYVKNLNDALAGNEKLLSLPVETLVASLGQVPEGVRMKVRNNGGGHANHSMFWTSMANPGKGGGGKPTGSLAKAMDAAFGSFETFQERFSAAGLGRFGSGWVWLVCDEKLTIVDTPNQDTPLMEGVVPILGLDVWEHAYYLKYQNLRGEYIKAWWSVVNWKEVERRFAIASK